MHEKTWLLEAVVPNGHNLSDDELAIEALRRLEAQRFSWQIGHVPGLIHVSLSYTDENGQFHSIFPQRAPTLIEAVGTAAFRGYELKGEVDKEIKEGPVHHTCETAHKNGPWSVWRLPNEKKLWMLSYEKHDAELKRWECPFCGDRLW
jgi:hypothetical protein